MPMMSLPGGRKFGIPDPPKARDGEPEYEYRYLAYPKALYKDEPDTEAGTPYTTILVANEGEETALGADWHDKPAAWAAPKPAAPKKAKSA